jgi:hypothetical protein
MTTLPLSDCTVQATGPPEKSTAASDTNIHPGDDVDLGLITFAPGDTVTEGDWVRAVPLGSVTAIDVSVIPANLPATSNPIILLPLLAGSSSSLQETSPKNIALASNAPAIGRNNLPECRFLIHYSLIREFYFYRHLARRNQKKRKLKRKLKLYRKKKRIT